MDIFLAHCIIIIGTAIIILIICRLEALDLIEGEALTKVRKKFRNSALLTNVLNANKPDIWLRIVLEKIH